MSEKHKYHHGDLRQAILDAACEHLCDGNVEGMSLRAIARRIGVSQTAPYRHFDSKNALLAAVADWGFCILEAEIRLAQATSRTDPLGALLQMGLSYLKFAREHPEKYLLLFNSNLVDMDEYPDLQQRGSANFQLLLDVIVEGRQQGLLLDEPEVELAATVWSGLHGIAGLSQTSKLRPKQELSLASQAAYFLKDDPATAIQRLINGIVAS